MGQKARVGRNLIKHYKILTVVIHILQHGGQEGRDNFLFRLFFIKISICH